VEKRSNKFFLTKIREFEINFAIEHFGNKNVVLELGAGAGWQSQFLKSRGFDIHAIDIDQTNYKEYQVFPVTSYDGFNIPFKDRFFDIVFSSNVLEHISHLNIIHGEINRVLKDDGICVHILPTHTWRFWTSLTHYFAIPKNLNIYLKNFFSKSTRNKNELNFDKLEKNEGFSFDKVVNLFFSSRHGERGNRLSEFLFFHPKWWIKNFEENGYQITKHGGVGLFYTGHNIFGEKLSINTRRKLAIFFGSACHIYQAKKIN
jgi:SAM-dependent methyltransferase